MFFNFSFGAMKNVASTVSTSIKFNINITNSVGATLGNNSAWVLIQSGQVSQKNLLINLSNPTKATISDNSATVGIL